MATKIIGQGKAAPNTTPPRTVADVHQHALDVLKEFSEDQDKLYSIAFAGTKCCSGDDQITERNLFAVIETMSSDQRLFTVLRGLIYDLARAAGSDYVEGANHG